MFRDQRWPIRFDYRPPEPPSGWHDQDWLLVLVALEYYALEGDLTEGQELRAYQLLEQEEYRKAAQTVTDWNEWLECKDLPAVARGVDRSA